MADRRSESEAWKQASLEMSGGSGIRTPGMTLAETEGDRATEL